VTIHVSDHNLTETYQGRNWPDSPVASGNGMGSPLRVAVLRDDRTWSSDSSSPCRTAIHGYARSTDRPSRLVCRHGEVSPVMPTFLK